jgi:mRNA-degrading endonuclease RelE of RelBE toxin-antitoxin system
MNSEKKKPWFVVLTRTAQKSLDRVAVPDRARIIAAIEAMKEAPLQGDVRKLHGGHEGFRRRVGNWRIFFDLYSNENRIMITAIERRTSTTY